MFVCVDVGGGEFFFGGVEVLWWVVFFGGWGIGEVVLCVLCEGYVMVYNVFVYQVLVGLLGKDC